MSTPSLQPVPTVSRQPFGPPFRVIELRVGDADRSAVCEALSAHYAAGRLTDDELDDRVAVAVSARTAGELRLVLADLPPIGAPAPAPAVQTATGFAAASWTGLDVLALLCFLLTLVIGSIGALMLLLSTEVGYVVVATLSAITAGVGGMALNHLLRRTVDRQYARSDSRRWIHSGSPVHSDGSEG